MEQEDQAKKIQKAIAKAWLDESFKKKLLADPTASLAAEGVEIPPGIEVRFAEDTANVRNLVLPLRPPKGEVSDEHLKSGGGGKFLTMFTFQCGGPCLRN